MSRPHTSGSQRRSQVRIIGGRWKRTPLVVADIEGLRPTPDRVRETLFNWLGQDLSGKRVLDLFAGSGALSLEAASRGADRVVCVEQHATAARAIRQSADKLGADTLDLRQADASKVAETLAQQQEMFDLVFLDPPFHFGWIERMLPRVLPLLAPKGRIYVESEFELEDDALVGLGLEKFRKDSAGKVHYHLLQRTTRTV